MWLLELPTGVNTRRLNVGFWAIPHIYLPLSRVLSLNYIPAKACCVFGKSTRFKLFLFSSFPQRFTHKVVVGNDEKDTCCFSLRLATTSPRQQTHNEPQTTRGTETL
jgi:hypothetical protein